MSSAVSRIFARSGLALLLATASGCALSMNVPVEFLKLETSGHEIKATTPDEARLWIRDFNDPDHGTVEFWAETLKHELTSKRGYVLDSSQEVCDGAGRNGIELRFSTTVTGTPQGYLIALFVIEGSLPWQSNSIRVLEFVADISDFGKYVEAVHESIATLEG